MLDSSSQYQQCLQCDASFPASKLPHHLLVAHGEEEEKLPQDGKMETEELEEDDEMEFDEDDEDVLKFLNDLDEEDIMGDIEKDIEKELNEDSEAKQEAQANNQNIEGGKCDEKLVLKNSESEYMKDEVKFKSEIAYDTQREPKQGFVNEGTNDVDVEKDNLLQMINEGKKEFIEENSQVSESKEIKIKDKFSDSAEKVNTVEENNCAPANANADDFLEGSALDDSIAEDDLVLADICEMCDARVGARNIVNHLAEEHFVRVIIDPNRSLNSTLDSSFNSTTAEDPFDIPDFLKTKKPVFDFKCHHCQKGFETVDKLDRHTNKKHEKRCRICRVQKLVQENRYRTILKQLRNAKFVDKDDIPSHNNISSGEVKPRVFTYEELYPEQARAVKEFYRKFSQYSEKASVSAFKLFNLLRHYAEWTS